MTTALPIQHKPFCLEHAKAGAPIAIHDGRKATILKWNANSQYPLIGVAGLEDEVMTWTAEGKYYVGDDEGNKNLVMTPLGFIDGKPVFVGDELELKKEHCTDLYEEHAGLSTALPGWAKEWTPDIWQWPVPAREYPQTTMSTRDAVNSIRCKGVSLEVIAKDIPGFSERTIGDSPADFVVRNIANAALRHAVDAGQLVVPGDMKHLTKVIVNGTILSVEKLEVVGDQMVAYATDSRRVARDMAVTEAVRDTVYVAYMNSNRDTEAQKLRNLNLAAIIAKVAL